MKDSPTRSRVLQLAHPPIPIVRIGIIGLGNRGLLTLQRYLQIEGVEIKALCEIREGKKIVDNQLLKMKRLLLSPLKIKVFQNSRFVRRRSLALGDGICCPAVTFATQNLPKQVFTVHFRSDEDWEAWERLSKMKGTFAYDSTMQMGHRIHEESETSIIIGDNARSQEDYEMYCKFWPKWIAKLLVNVYSKSQDSNKTR